MTISGQRRWRQVVYALDLIGALVFFWQQADSFGQYLLAILKALDWPAFLVYEVFQGLLG